MKAVVQFFLWCFINWTIFTIEITVKWGESSLLKMIDKPTVDDSSGDELGEWGEGGGRRGRRGGGASWNNQDNADI